MTETSTIKDIVVSVLEMAQKAGAYRVSEVQLILGRSAHIAEDNILEYFKIMSLGTLAEDARLTILHESATYKCLHCSYEFKSGLECEDLLCPRCASSVVEMEIGQPFCLGNVGIVQSRKLNLA